MYLISYTIPGNITYNICIYDKSVGLKYNCYVITVFNIHIHYIMF
jgi:hypothetical protein